METCVLHLGTNLGARLINLELALVRISSLIGSIYLESQIYETAAWGVEDQPNYLNQAIAIRTALKADALLVAIHKIEYQLGRTRNQKWAARVIDIDILFYGAEIIEKPNLKIPHPELTNRNFVLRPLLDILPDLIHPQLGQSITELNQACTDTGVVNRI